jgi:hypothetical protein
MFALLARSALSAFELHALTLGLRVRAWQPGLKPCLSLCTVGRTLCICVQWEFLLFHDTGDLPSIPVMQ